VKDITPQTKDRVRVAAGREGGPMPVRRSQEVAAPADHAVVAGPEPTNFLAIIARAAADPRTDVAKMQALLDMQRQIEDRDAMKAFNAAFVALQRDLPAIKRDGKIEIREKDAAGGRSGKVQQSTPYATFNNIMKVLKPLLERHGFTLSFATEPALDGARIMVRGFLDHIGGHQRSTAFPLPAETSGSKNNVQGWGSSMSYGKRYCTIALLNIVSEALEDADTDGHIERNMKPAAGGGFAEVEERKTISEEQIIVMRDLVEWCGVPKAKFLEHYTIKKLADLPADLFEVAKKDCQQFHANQQRKA